MFAAEGPNRPKKTAKNPPKTGQYSPDPRAVASPELP
jgi:hypothetical protein